MVHGIRRTQNHAQRMLHRRGGHGRIHQEFLLKHRILQSADDYYRSGRPCVERTISSAEGLRAACGVERRSFAAHRNPVRRKNPRHAGARHRHMLADMTREVPERIAHGVVVRHQVVHRRCRNRVGVLVLQRICKPQPAIRVVVVVPEAVVFVTIF